jgi:ribosomal-protein-alanine N-acetyltransferase
VKICDFFSKNPQIETSRLLLRKIAPRDAKDMYEYASLPETSKYLLWDPHPSFSYTADLINFLQKEYPAGRFNDFAIILKETDKMIGTVGFTSFDGKNRCAEIGYVISPKYWRQGIATEALSTIIELSFSELSVERVEAKYMPENVFSGRVMEKCGMKREGVLRRKLFVKGKFCDIAYFSILREEFLRENREKSYNITYKEGFLKHFLRYR